MDHLFTTADLDLLVLENPPNLPRPLSTDGSDWLSSLSVAKFPIRQQVFYDESLHLHFVLRLPVTEPLDSPSPSRILFRLLSCLQLSIEATYISASPSAAETVSPPPRTFSLTSVPTAKANLPPSHATTTVIQPSTPHPIPHSATSDIPYLHSDGTILASYLWGQNDNSPVSSD